MMVKEQWFLDAIAEEPSFFLLGVFRSRRSCFGS